MTCAKDYLRQRSEAYGKYGKRFEMRICRGEEILFLIEKKGDGDGARGDTVL